MRSTNKENVNVKFGKFAETLITLGKYIFAGI